MSANLDVVFGDIGTLSWQIFVLTDRFARFQCLAKGTFHTNRINARVSHHKSRRGCELTDRGIRHARFEVPG